MSTPPAPEEKRRCKAHSRTGERCKYPPVPGATVCRFHGGNAPQVRRKAALRLAELVDPAIATMAQVMVDRQARHSDRLRAAENVLDRAGVPRKVDVEDATTSREILLDRLTALREQRERGEGMDDYPGGDTAAGDDDDLEVSDEG